MSGMPKLSERTTYYLQLETDIQQLKRFAEPLQKEFKTTPLMGVISKILALDEDFDSSDSERVKITEAEVKECERLLSEISYEYVCQIISKPEPSKVFKILANANKFEKLLKSKIGENLKMPDGRSVILTPEIVECLTRYRFSLGTPPITPEGIETVESILFGGTLPDIYDFRDLIQVDRGVFDRFLGAVDRLVEQSTHYTTANEKEDFERKGQEFPGLKGMRGLTKAVITGNSRSAIRLIKDHLLSKHHNGSQPLKIVDGVDKLDDDLISEMTVDKKSIFVVRVSSVDHNVLTSDSLHSKWKGLIGRLVIIDESENAQRSGTTFVYALNPRITEALSEFHVKDSGTPANTQMNLRLILNNFKATDLDDLEKSIKGKMAQLESEGINKIHTNKARKQEWVLSAQKDYLALKKFSKFLEFIKKMKTADPAELERYSQELAKKTADQSMDYFFKNLKGKNYRCISVPQGGGRRELVHAGKFHLQKSRSNLANFQQNKLAACRTRLNELKAAQGISPTSTAAEKAALERAMAQRVGPNAVLHQDPGNQSAIVEEISAAVDDVMHNVELKGEALIHKIIEKLDDILGFSPADEFKAAITKALRWLGIESAAKMLERGGFLQAANRLRAFTGKIHRTGLSVTAKVAQRLDVARRNLEPADLDLAESMLNEIESQSFQPSIALAKMSWTVGDVLMEDDYPAKNYISIEMAENGQLDPYSLEKQLEAKQKALADFPELFELYCSNIILYLNDPHNPTSQVATNKVKLKFLDIASKYKITILSDEPYHKQVSKDVKTRQGDVSLAEFYEQNNNQGKGRFPNPVTIYTAISTTKWAMRAGGRTGIVLTNDQYMDDQGRSFDKFVADNTDAINTASLYMDRETLQTGLQVKKVCKALEGTTLLKNPIKAIDALLAEDFADLKNENFNAPIYGILIEARNNLDRLRSRGAKPPDYKRYMNSVISKLKALRLDKKTQRDSAERGKAAVTAIKNLSKEFPGIEKRFIEPQGPFYCCVRLDETGKDDDLQDFLEVIAKSRKIDVVPLEGGFVRFAFGGNLDGSKKGYELLTLAIETDLRLLLKYWETFKQTREALNQSGDSDPVHNALKQIFPGGEIELVQAMEDKKELIEKLQANPPERRKKLTQRFSATDSKYLSSIEPESPGTIVSINSVECETVEAFIASRAFKDLFNHYLLKAKKSIPALAKKDDQAVLEDYSATAFAEIFKTKQFGKEELVNEIAVKVANLWFADDNIKTLGLKFPEKMDAKTKADAIMGASEKISRFIKQFMLVVAGARESEINYKPAFQVGYESISGVKADPDLPEWHQNLINYNDFVAQSVATDPSPKMVTSNTARVNSHEMGIFRRDGDGKTAPTLDFFRKRLGELTETMKKDYICKMVQVGPTRTLMVLHKSFKHYLAEELRLLPQFDVSMDDLDKLNPDAVSFMGIPTKVMGKDYRIGYILDKTKSQKTIPVSWVNAENRSDYMGYLKKPVLTVGNERVKLLGGLPVHGAAFVVKMKNGMRKTIVVGGDSATGKSETLIAMRQQIYNKLGGAENVEDIELLSGDMLSLWIGEDKQIYLCGTEEGDFMRLTDIGEDWQKVNQDLIQTSSQTNLNDPTNPRATIPGLCDPQSFLGMVRVNMFLCINNFEKPSGSAFQEEKDLKNLLLDIYVKAYRREKGTSGDQPNIFASILHSESSRKQALLTKHKETFDKLLGWDLTLAKNGKVKQAILSFNEIHDQETKKMPGRAAKAKIMAKDLFKGETLDTSSLVAAATEAIYKSIEAGNTKGLTRFINKKIGSPGKNDFHHPLHTALTKIVRELKDMQAREAVQQDYDEFIDKLDEKISPKSYVIKKVKYDVQQNRFSVLIQDKDGEKREVNLDRSVFDQIYNPIASTYCGNPFVDPRGFAEILERFAPAMQEAGIVGGVLYTQLAVEGEEFSGPTKASQAIIELIENDQRFNERFQERKAVVIQSLIDKYGVETFGSADLPQDIQKFNLLLLELQDSQRRMVDKEGNPIPLQTPYYDSSKISQFDPTQKITFNSSLLTPEIYHAIHDTLENPDAQNSPTEGEKPNLDRLGHIKTANSKEELVYQILLANGAMRLGDDYKTVSRWTEEIMTANTIADMLLATKPGIINSPT